MKRGSWQWRKYWMHHSAHFLQGIPFGTIPVISIILLWATYIIYQKVEYQRARDLRESEISGWEIIQDWISRDVMVMMAGMWVGFFLQVGVVTWLVTLLTG